MVNDAHTLGKSILSRLDRYPTADVRAEEITAAGIPADELGEWAREIDLEVQLPLFPGAPYRFRRGF